MKLNTKNGVQFYTFDLFDNSELVRHGFSTRVGGVSQGCFESLNLGYNKGDDKASVDENFRRLSHAVGFSPDDMVFSSQCHGTAIYKADEKDRGKGFTRKSDITQIDGLVTDRRQVVLTTFYADCVPLFFLDPHKKVIALAHAGWRGTLNGIAQLIVEEMQGCGCQGRDILVGIGPSIGSCCFEVDYDVAETFENAAPFFRAFISRWEDRPRKYMIDLWSMNAELLIRSGVLDRHIELSGLCTQCNPAQFYSYRGMGAERGTMTAVLELI